MSDLSAGLAGRQLPSGGAPVMARPRRGPALRSGLRHWRQHLVVIQAVGLGCLIGAATAYLPPSLLVLGLSTLLIVLVVAVRPAVGAYVLIGVTPLVAGMDRGLVIPVLRPNEAVLLLVAAGLLVRGVMRAASGTLPRPTIGATDLAILLLAFTSSALPLAVMLARDRPVAQDDLLYALMVWKYYGVYLVARTSIRTDDQVRICLWVSMIAASLVAGVAVLQALQLFGVPRALSTYYAPYGSTEALLNNRGGSTLALPIAVADLLTFNLGIVVGLLVRRSRARPALVILGATFVIGVLASGQISGAFGLVLGVVVMAVVTRRVRLLAAFIPIFAVAILALQPVVNRRLEGFDSASGLPVSWAGRLYNLTNYFWPELFSHGNFLLGVRPAARVATATMATGYVWIESGYTWLLWAGGIPLLLSFIYFLWTNLRRHLAITRDREDAVGAAALAVVVALVVIGVLMLIDPHLTYRGSADLLFVLLGLTSGTQVGGSEPLGGGTTAERQDP